MGKPIYGEFTFSKSSERPKVKGYAFGGQTTQMSASMPTKDSMLTKAPPPKPVAQPRSVTPPTTTANKPIVGGLTNTELAYAKKTNQRIDPNDYASMAKAVENAEIRGKALDARLKEEARRNVVPASQNPYAPLQKSMDAIQARSSVPVKRAKGGETRAATKKELSYLTKAKAPKEVMMHEKAEMRGKVGDTKPMVKKELSILRTAGAPSKIIKEEQKEMSSPLMAKTGGKIGLWDNIHAKRKRIENGSGERMRKPGSKGAPTAKDLRVSAKKMEEGGKADMSQDKAMIKKAMKQHDQQEHQGGKGTVLKLRKGGVPAYNKSPKIC
jgi:hypothetical protein